MNVHTHVYVCMYILLHIGTVQFLLILFLYILYFYGYNELIIFSVFLTSDV